jgi:hypothetical protein
MYKLQIRYSSKRHFQTIETSIGTEGLVWGFRQCLAPYGVASVRVVAPDGTIVVRAAAQK